MRCTATRVDGSECHALAMRNDPDQRCGFHSKRNSFAVQRASDFTKQEAVKKVTQAIRALRKSKRDTVEQAQALKDLIQLWREMTAPEPPTKSLTLAERIKMVEEEGKKK